MEYVEIIKTDLAAYIDQEKAEFLPRFFNAFPGGYGEGTVSWESGYLTRGRWPGSITGRFPWRGSVTIAV